jgi:hypothetical protein
VAPRGVTGLRLAVVGEARRGRPRRARVRLDRARVERDRALAALGGAAGARPRVLLQQRARLGDEPLHLGVARAARGGGGSDDGQDRGEARGEGGGAQERAARLRATARCRLRRLLAEAPLEGCAYAGSRCGGGARRVAVEVAVAVPGTAGVPMSAPAAVAARVASIPSSRACAAASASAGCAFRTAASSSFARSAFPCAASTRATNTRGAGSCARDRTAFFAMTVASRWRPAAR